MRLDGKDIVILVHLWEEGARRVELAGDPKETSRRLYRLSRANMCGSSRQDNLIPGGRNDPIWGINPEGERAIELAEADHAGAWREEGWSMEYKAAALDIDPPESVVLKYDEEVAE